MKKKLFMIFGLPALLLLVVMAADGLLFERAIVIRHYVFLYVALVAMHAFNVLRGPFKMK